MSNKLSIAIDTWRVNQDLSIRHAAEKIGISHVSLARIINGLTEIPDLDTLDLIAKAMRVDLAYIVEIMGFPLKVGCQPDLATLFENDPRLRKLMQIATELSNQRMDDLIKYAEFLKSRGDNT
jgi:transcriptional regulator with XRE-family HTH domain